MPDADDRAQATFDLTREDWIATFCRQVRDEPARQAESRKLRRQYNRSFLLILPLLTIMAYLQGGPDALAVALMAIALTTILWIVFAIWFTSPRAYWRRLDRSIRTGIETGQSSGLALGECHILLTPEGLTWTQGTSCTTTLWSPGAKVLVHGAEQAQREGDHEPAAYIYPGGQNTPTRVPRRAFASDNEWDSFIATAYELVAAPGS